MITDREIKLIKIIEELVDYAGMMKCATGYRGEKVVDLGSILRYISKIKREEKYDRKLQKYFGNDKNQ